MKKATLNRLLTVGNYSELFGLVSGYNLKKVTDKIRLWGLTGDLWTKKAIETVIFPFRKHARQQNLSEKAIDAALNSFAETAKIDANLVRRVYWGVASSEPKKKFEEISEEAEDDLPEFETDEEESEEETT